MSETRMVSPTQLAALASLALLPVVTSLKEAIFLGAACVISVLLFEILLWASGRFRLKSLLPAVALILSASVLTGASLLGSKYLSSVPPAPLALPSAFLLASSSMLEKKNWMRSTVLSWLGFLLLLLIIGACRQWSQSLETFSPVSFWIAGLGLAASFSWKKGKPA